MALGKFANRIVGSGEESLDQIQFNPRNWRVHPLNQQNALKGVLEEVGWVQEVIVNKRTGNLIDGHLRCQLAAREGAKTIPVKYVDLSEEEEGLILSTLDPIAAMAATDKAKLDELFAGIETENADVLKMLDDIAEKERLEYGKKEVDAEPQIDTNQTLKLSELMDLREKWDVNIGQVWRCGDHTVMCGDSTKQETFDTLFETIQRPEYLIYDPDWDSGLSIPEYEYQGIIAYSDGYRARDVIKMFGLPTWIFAWDGCTSWYTPNRPLRRAKLALWFGDIEQYNFDGAHYGDAGEEHEVKNSRGAYTFHPDPRGKHLSDIFQMPLPQLHNDGFHPYEKPLDWVRLLIGDCFSGNSVFDPFLGCGNTALACQQLGKSCVGIDIEPMYIAFLLEQFSKIGIQPVLEVNSVSDL